MRKAMKFLFILFVLVLFFAPVCMATNNTNNVTSTPSEVSSTNKNVINNDLFSASSDSVVIEDIIEGNAFIYSNNVTIKGEIRGDVFIAGRSVTIDKSAVITGNLFVYGIDVTISGVVDNVYGFITNFTIEDSGRVNRDINAIVKVLTLKGYIARNANLSVSSMVLPDDVQNVIGGNLNYSSSQDLNVPSSAVKGEINVSIIVNEAPSTGELILNYINDFIIVLAYALVIILLVAFFAPNFKEKLTYALEKRAFASAGIGILTIILVPFIAIALMITGYLLYIGIFLLAVYVIILSITISILSIAVGNYLTNKCKNKTKVKFILLSVLSAVVIWLLQLIPTFGGWMSIFTVVFGFGLFIFAFFTKKDLTNLNGQNATATNTATTTTAEQPKVDGQQK